MITSDLAINIIEGHIRNVLDDFRDERDEWKSTAKWAAVEAMNRILDKPHANPVDILQKFYDDLEECEYKSGGSLKASLIFHEALEEVESLGQMFV